MRIVDGVKHYQSASDDPVLGQERMDCGPCSLRSHKSGGDGREIYDDCEECLGAGYMICDYTQTDINTTADHIRNSPAFDDNVDLDAAIASMYPGQRVTT